MQAEIDTNFAAADLGFSGVAGQGYTAGDIQVSIDAQDRLVLTVRDSANGEAALGAQTDTGGANISAIETGDGASYTAAAAGAITEVTAGNYSADAAAQVRFTGGTFDNTYSFAAANQSGLNIITANGVTIRCC